MSTQTPNWTGDTIPPIVMFIKIAAVTGMPVGTQMLEEALEKYPEYFPEIVAHREKWNSIPQLVKNDYYEDLTRLKNEVYANAPQNKGILYWSEHPDEFHQFLTTMEPLDQKFTARSRELYNQYFSQYGLTK